MAANGEIREPLAEPLRRARKLAGIADKEFASFGVAAGKAAPGPSLQIGKRVRDLETLVQQGRERATQTLLPACAARAVASGRAYATVNRDCISAVRRRAVRIEL